MRRTGPGSCPPSPAPLQFCLRENSTSTSTSTSTSAKRGDCNLIDRAAKTRGKNRTDFILEAARLAAEDALLDQVIISVSPEAYSEFLARLDMPPKLKECLRKTMQTPAPWES
jgi:uncharacterized protein (DUF1778 family)